jgi:hypothetical protein
VTNRRLREHPAYQKGRDLADGFEPNGVQWINSPEGERAFRAGHADRMEEIIREQEAHRLANEDLGALLMEAQQEQCFGKLCIVVARLIEKMETD